MRRLLLLAALAPLPAAAEIRSAEDCAAAVAADPATAREEAALWARTGGGVPARLCEADALAALGAHGSAALLLTRVAESRNRAMPAPLRAVVFEDAAGVWIYNTKWFGPYSTKLTGIRFSPIGNGQDMRWASFK